MYYVWYEKISEEKGRIVEVSLQGYEGNKSKEEMDKAIEMPGFPEPEYKEGYIAMSYINPKTKEYIYEYEPAPLTQEQEIEKIKKELELAQQAIDELLLAKSE